MRDQTLLADKFANYFATVGDRSVQDHPLCDFTPEECSRHPSVRAISSKWDSNLFSFRKISAQNVNPNKAVGFDMIPSHVLKIAAEELGVPLGRVHRTEIFNVFQKSIGRIHGRIHGRMAS